MNLDAQIDALLTWLSHITISDVITLVGVVASLSGGAYWRFKQRGGSKTTKKVTTTTTTKKVVKTKPPPKP
jgi:hypothetical protein